MRHHTWCNNQNVLFPEAGAESCEMCHGLRRDYPEDGKTEDELLKAHFPTVRQAYEPTH